MDWKKLVVNIVLVVQGMIVFMLLFESKVVVPTFLQPLGRMHPLLLHFPIVFIVLLGVLELFKNNLQKRSFKFIQSVLLYATVFTTSLTALFGFFLSAEGGYSGNSLLLHKWMGILLSFTVFALVYLKPTVKYFRYVVYTNVFLVIGAGHFGASLTHGEGFLLEPVLPKTTPVIAQNTPVYTAVIQPILESKCTSCHNPSKMKGDLDMSTFENLLKGGKDGEILVRGNAEESNMIKRIMLPVDHDDHMPPDGKPQLNDREVALLKGWINMSADNVFTLASLSSHDSLYNLAQAHIDKMYPDTKKKSYDFSYASPSTIEKLNNPFRTVKQTTPGSPALDVDIFVRQAYKLEYLEELKDVKDQIVSLNLSYLPIEDKDIETISSFENLEKLLLNYTDITGSTLGLLSACENLEILSITGTKINPEVAEELKKITSLEIVYVWDTEITPEKAAELQKDFPNTTIDSGFDPKNAVPLKLSPPLLSGEERVLKRGSKVDLTHKLPETTIFYTLDGSDPDSTSNVYKEPIPVEEIDILKAIAVKKGWEKSNAITTSFFIDGFSPKVAKLTQPADQKYKGSGEKTIIDKRKGEIGSFNNPLWLGYQKNPFETLVDFGSDIPTLNSVVLSYGVNMGSYIMDPVKVEVYGGNSPSSMKLLKSMVPEAPTELEPNKVVGLKLATNNSKYRYYKVKAYPVTKLPEWHPGSGEPGWVFVDEVFFY